MMAQSIASTNARLTRARAVKITIAGVKEEPEACCDVCETVIGESDFAINERITTQLSYE